MNFIKKPKPNERAKIVGPKVQGPVLQAKRKKTFDDCTPCRSCNSMWSALRSRSLSSAVQPWKQQQQKLGLSLLNRALFSSSMVEEPPHDSNNNNIIRSSREMLNLEEVETILSDVKADNVEVIPVPKHYDFADYMVIATGRSAWHVRNIAQALIYKVKQKQKQKGAKRMLLPSVEGQEGGKWIVIDSGALIIHALDEKVRTYYNLEKLWTSGTTNNEQAEDLEKAFVKIRPKNNSKKPSKKQVPK